MVDVLAKPSTLYSSNNGIQTGASAQSVVKDIDLIKSNELTRIVITPTVGETVTGANDVQIECFGRGEFEMGGSAQWNSAFEDALAAQSSKQITGLINRIGGKAFPTFSVQARQQTIRSWSGSGPCTLNFDLYFLATDKSHDVRKDAAKLLNLIYPIQSSADDTIVIAPMGHVATLAKNGGKGLSAIKIGNWFSAPAFFLCEHVSNQFAYTPIEGGNPLYVRISVSFVTSELVTIKEIREWLGQSEGTPTTNLSYSQLGSSAAGLLNDLTTSLGNLNLNPFSDNFNVGSANTPQVGTSNPQPLPVDPSNVPTSDNSPAFDTAVSTWAGAV